MRILKHFKTLFSNSKSIMDEFASPSFAQLKNRSHIIIQGPDTRKLLQGIITNNVEDLYKPNEEGKVKTSIYAMFLNPKGKIITDSLIIRPRIFEKGKVVEKED